MLEHKTSKSQSKVNENKRTEKKKTYIDLEKMEYG